MFPNCSVFRRRSKRKLRKPGKKWRFQPNHEIQWRVTAINCLRSQGPRGAFYNVYHTATGRGIFSDPAYSRSHILPKSVCFSVLQVHEIVQMVGKSLASSSYSLFVWHRSNSTPFCLWRWIWTWLELVLIHTSLLPQSTFNKESLSLGFSSLHEYAP